MEESSQNLNAYYYRNSRKPEGGETLASKKQRREEKKAREADREADLERFLQEKLEKKRAADAEETSHAPPPQPQRESSSKTKNEEPKPHYGRPKTADEKAEAQAKANFRRQKAAKESKERGEEEERQRQKRKQFERDQFKQKKPRPTGEKRRAKVPALDPVLPKPRSQPLASLQWSAKCASFFSDRPLHATAPFPDPPRPLARCKRPKCLYSEVLRCCHHEMKKTLALAAGVECTLDFLKKERVRWHPDKFSGVVEGRRGEIQRRAKEVFQLVQRLIDDES